MGRFGRLLLAVLMVALLSGGCASQQESRLSALHFFRKGNEAFQAEDFQRAVGHYRRALGKDDSAPQIHYNLGLALFKAGEYREAVAAFQEALRIDPMSADAHFNLALTHDRLYNSESAHSHYNTYRTLVAGNAPAQKRMAAPPVPAARPPEAAPAAARPGTAKAPRTGIQGGRSSAPSLSKKSPAQARQEMARAPGSDRQTSAGKTAPQGKLPPHLQGMIQQRPSPRPTQQQTQVPQASQSTNKRGATSKWWIQDQYTRNQ